MSFTDQQRTNKDLIEKVAQLAGIGPAWAVSIAMTESSLGLNQKSPTGCRGVFQMSGIAMKDLLQAMESNQDDVIDILCGVAFLYLLFKRHGSIEAATAKFCSPTDIDFYVPRVLSYMEMFSKKETL